MVGGWQLHSQPCRYETRSPSWLWLRPKQACSAPLTPGSLRSSDGIRPVAAGATRSSSGTILNRLGFGVVVGAGLVTDVPPGNGMTEWRRGPTRRPHGGEHGPPA